MALQPSTNSTPFSTVLAAVVTRLATIPDSGIIRLCASDEDKLLPYLAQAGYLVRPDVPRPRKGCGAGRYGLLADRQIEVWVVTQSYSDFAGDDTSAVMAHSDAEEAAVDCLALVPWGGQAFEAPVIAITVHWVPGGQPILRTRTSDPGILSSSLIFDIQYTVPCTVNL